jgi:hypothetical protein
MWWPSNAMEAWSTIIKIMTKPRIQSIEANTLRNAIIRDWMRDLCDRLFCYLKGGLFDQVHTAVVPNIGLGNRCGEHHVGTNGQMYDCPTRAAFIAGIKWAFMWDLRTYPNAPSAIHAFMNGSSEWTVRNTILADKADSRSRWAASIPFKTGIVISATITSGQRRRASDTRVAPSVAVPTTSN